MVRVYLHPDDRQNLPSSSFSVFLAYTSRRSVVLMCVCSGGIVVFLLDWLATIFINTQYCRYKLVRACSKSPLSPARSWLQ